MPEPSSPFSSLLKWIGGILATVISGLLLFWGQNYLTNHPSRPKPVPVQRERKQAKSQSPVQVFSIDGRLLDKARTKLLDNAWVRLEISASAAEQKTDSEGRYAFSVEGFDPGLTGSMSVKADGYKPLQLSLSLSEMQQKKEQLLELEHQRFSSGDALKDAIAQGGKGAAIGAALGAGVKHDYVMRHDPMKIIAPQ